MTAPIDLYTWPTPNGFKLSIMLEELGVPYAVHPVNIGEGEQHEPAFLKISPNNKIPAIVDPDGPDGAPISMFESGAILVYLANKYDRLLPQETRAHYEVIQWLIFQMGNVGPFFGQAHHFRMHVEDPPKYAYDRYTNETHRLYQVMDGRLAKSRYLASDDYTIADIATWPWVSRFEWHGIDWANYPNVRRWFNEIWARPAVKRGRVVPRAGAIWAGALPDDETA